MEVPKSSFYGNILKNLSDECGFVNYNSFIKFTLMTSLLSPNVIIISNDKCVIIDCYKFFEHEVRHSKASDVYSFLTQGFDFIILEIIPK